ncbi:ethanolamine utilization protein EutN [candidate division KSB3 bacterium]|uniref:Ethanolamine utilization protein EutN n=1 Tax=candidate division KSB3 bacterium TaxID=2044937 RepID=A0A9D5JWL0_9BACT|nr:ethanolamine utilization protein EutN [candidate division KSB3 bacterium]MBD3325480.1 ethanolamine utilization protein EutN [candidate division KSB3 bacterium]
MLLARVVGTVVSTHKTPKIEGIKFLLLENLDPATMQGKHSYVVAMDAVGAGMGEVVFYVSGSSARMTEVTQGKPADASIVAIVDNIEKDGQYVYQKDTEMPDVS